MSYVEEDEKSETSNWREGLVSWKDSHAFRKVWLLLSAFAKGENGADAVLYDETHMTYSR